MLSLSPQDDTEMIDIITPYVTEKLMRLSLVVETFGIEHPFVDTIDYAEGGARPFAIYLITEVIKRGGVVRGKSAILVLLETLKHYYIHDIERGEKIDAIIAKRIATSASAGHAQVGVKTYSPIQEHKTVFICSRRDATSYFCAVAIAQNLRANDYDVFMDTELHVEAIFRQIKARAHFLIIFASGTADDFDWENDMMRRQIEHAIAIERNIIPLIIDNFEYDTRTKKHFQGTLASVPWINPISIPYNYFDGAMERLRENLQQQFRLLLNS
jgi:hypothetical protein